MKAHLGRKPCDTVIIGSRFSFWGSLVYEGETDEDGKRLPDIPGVRYPMEDGNKIKLLLPLPNQPPELVEIEHAERDWTAGETTAVVVRFYKDRDISAYLHYAVRDDAGIWVFRVGQIGDVHVGIESPWPFVPL